MYEAPQPALAKKANLSRTGLIFGYVSTWMASTIWILCVDLYFLIVENEGTLHYVFTEGLRFSISVGLIAGLPGAINGALLGTLIYRNKHTWWECLGISLLISTVGSFPCVTCSLIMTADPPPGYTPPYGLIMSAAFVCYMSAMLLTSRYLYKRRQKLPAYIPPKRAFTHEHTGLPFPDTRFINDPPPLRSSSPKIEKKLGPSIPPPSKKE